MLRLTLLLLVLASLLLAFLAPAGGSSVVTVAVDLYHAPIDLNLPEDPSMYGLDVLIESCPGCKWVLLTRYILITSGNNTIYTKYSSIMPVVDKYRSMGYNVEVREVGEDGFREGALDGVDILVIGAVHGRDIKGFSEAEFENLARWWASEGRKVVWIASVGDYIVEYLELRASLLICTTSKASAPGGHSQFNANMLLETLGSRIRVDWASISSPQSPVEGIIVGGALGLKGGKVILPMAAPLYVVQDNTLLNPLHTSLEGVSVVVYSESTISDHDNQSPVFYRVEAREAYPVMVVERRDNRMFVVSGDTMIGGFLDAEILTRIGTCYIRPLQAGLYNSYWEWLTQTGELRRESFNGPELVKATIADAIRFVAGDQAEKLLPGKPKTEAPTGYTTVHAEYNREGERRVWLRISWLSIAAFILAFVIVLFLLRLLRRA